MGADRVERPALEPAGFFVMRTPLLPHDELTAWSRGLRAGVETTDAATLAADRRLLRERLRAIVARPEVREALFVASPSLDESLPAWLEAPEAPRGQNVERTLVRYFIRMTSRPTPFGLFAGCSVGSVAERTDLRLGARADYRRHPRLDSGYLFAVTERLARDPAVRRALCYRPNDSAHPAAGKLRLAEARLDGTSRSFALTTVDLTPPLEAILARCARGARFDALVEAVCAAAADATREEAEAFLEEVIDAQIIVPDLQPLVTGADPLTELASQLRATATAEIAAAALERARTGLDELRGLPLGASPARYRRIAEGLADIPVAADPSRLFQVDLMKPAPDARLGRDVIAQIASAVELLQSLAPPPSTTSALARFVKAFVARYEEQEVPLALALDEDIGVGFAPSTSPANDPSPLLQGLGFPPRPRDDEPRVGPGFAHLLARFAAAMATGAREIVLGPADVAAVTLARRAGVPEPVRLPDAAAALVTLSGPSPEAVANGEGHIWLHSVVGPSGANLLGRFCHADPELTRQVRAHLAQEEAARPDVLFAEIVHLPEGRIGNLLARPLLRQWELPFLGRSGAPRERQIPLADLLVSVRDGRVRLRSRSLGREVVPRLTTAHRHATARCLGVYRFLCALQSQDTQSLAFDWGALAAAPFLPRVRSGRVVLSLARWRVDRELLGALWRDDRDETFRAVQRMRSTLDLPRQVAVTDGDNVLRIDLDNVLAVETFAQLVHRRTEVVLTELLGAPGMCAYGPEGRYAHEIVVPLQRPRLPAGLEAPVEAPPAPEAAPRRFSPGSEWLYAKLYAGAGSIDGLLRESLAPIVADALASRAVDRWFFVRYSDPDWHLRVRFHGAPADLARELVPRVLSAGADAIAQGLGWRVQIDTYEREVERYGGEVGIALAEELFFADSDAALAIVQALRGDGAADARWRLALLGIDRLLDDLGLPLAAKATIVRRARDSFAREHRIQAPFERQLGEKFRSERCALEALLGGERSDDAAIAAGVLAFAHRSQRVQRIAARLRAARSAGTLALSIDELAASYMHMHANRLLRASARAEELVLYDFLSRLYAGQIARARGR